MSLYYDGEPEGPRDRLPAFDEIHYAFLEEEDEYSLVGFKAGLAVFTGLLPAGRLETVAGPVIANAIALGQGTVVEDEFWDADGEHPFRSLPLHEKELNQMDKDWLKSMGVGGSEPHQASVKAGFWDGDEAFLEEMGIEPLPGR